MQTLDLSGTGPRSENRLKNLFWPTVKTADDVDYIGVQGYWVCAIVAGLALAVSLLTGQWFSGILAVLIYYVGGVGVRQHSLFAAAMVFVFFLLNLVGSAANGLGGFMMYSVRILLCAILLSNLRATLIASFWEKGSAEAEMPARFGETWGDKFVDKFPAWFWPKIRIVYYIYSILFLLLATLGLISFYIARHDPELLRRITVRG
ncbi:MAG TPA: hypothetical protein VMM16_11580 [Verrucomicrobiae bacterium]|nr:hypothetical protein [Verrucomicrobiae bacterium]